MNCTRCHNQMNYVHGHASCLNGSCAMFGLNQAECCDGETIAICATPTSVVAAGPSRQSQ